jgi:hypothetical protein
MITQHVLPFVLFAPLFSGCHFFEPCFEHVSHCCKDGSCLDKDESVSRCIDRQAGGYPFEGNC